MPLTEKIWRMDPPEGIFDDTVVRNLYPDQAPGARRALIHRALVSGEIRALKPGLYSLAPDYQHERPHPFAIAALLHSPSYVSLESALRHHHLIPEAVFQVASVCGRRSRSFTTPLGVFTFDHVPCRCLKAGVRAEQFGRAWAFVARPLRAIADLVYLRHLDWKRVGPGYLIDSMRIEPEELAAIPTEDYPEVEATFRSRRVLAWLAGMKKEWTR